MHEFVRTPKTPGGQKRRAERLEAEKQRVKSRLVSPMAWQSRLADAYSARDRFFKLNKMQQERIIRSLSRLDITNVQIVPSNNGPFINVFINAPSDLRGTSLTTRRKEIGQLYINLIFTNSNYDLKDTQKHEEEHQKTRLNYSISESIKSVKDIEHVLQSEIAAKIKSLITQKIFFFNSHNFLESLKLYLEDALSHLQKYRKISESKKEELYTNLSNYLEIIVSTIQTTITTKILTPEEIINALQQTTWEEIPEALEKRVKLKEYYLAKRAKKKK